MTREHLIREENRRIRMLRIAADLLVQTILTGSVDSNEVVRMVRGLRALSEKLFPGKGHVFDLIYAPRFKRAAREAGIADLDGVEVFPANRARNNGA